jgi:hypothetical protein
MPTSQSVPDQCPYCLQPLEIVALQFSFWKPCKAIFVCSSCGQIFTEGEDGSKNKRPRVRHLNAYRLWAKKRAATNRSTAE